MFYHWFSFSHAKIDPKAYEVHPEDPSNSFELTKAAEIEDTIFDGMGAIDMVFRCFTLLFTTCFRTFHWGARFLVTLVESFR